MPSRNDVQELRSIALQAATVARGVIMPFYASGTTVDFKADGTPVTAADRDAEEAMRSFLLRECPSHGVLGEEFGETTSDSAYRWVLDPIDGTKAFVHHVPLFGTLIALEYERTPIVGVIACHAAGETAVGAKGLGTTINDVPVRVSETSDTGEATVLTTSTQRLSAEHPRVMERLNERANLVRTWGDCFGYLSVAAGRAEAMIDPVMSYWDVAALYPVVTEAGGRITTVAGEDGPGDSVLATNGRLHAEMLDMFRS